MKFHLGSVLTWQNMTAYMDKCVIHDYNDLLSDLRGGTFIQPNYFNMELFTLSKLQLIALP